jgi:hypothetical protein
VQGATQSGACWCHVSRVTSQPHSVTRRPPSHHTLP